MVSRVRSSVSGWADNETAFAATALAVVLDTLPLGVGVYGRDGDLIHSNQRMRDYVGLTRLPSREPESSKAWRGYDADNRLIPPERFPGARALRGEFVTPGIDFLYAGRNASERWMRVSAVPFRPEGNDSNAAIVVVQDVDDLKRAAERIAVAAAEFASQSRFLNATLSSIPDYIYAFDPQHRFVYANPAMLALFGLSADEMLGRDFADLGYPGELADRLHAHIDRVLTDGVTVKDEVFFRSPIGYGAYFAFLWGPVRAADGTVELVVGVSRDTTERHAFEEALKTSEARLRAATELVGLGVYSGIRSSARSIGTSGCVRCGACRRTRPSISACYEAGIHPDDLARVRDAIVSCADPAGDGRYNIEYRVIGRG